MKICTHCSAEKPLEEFRRTNLSPTGRANICKVCAKKRRDKKQREAAKAPADPDSAIDAKDGPVFTVGRGLGFTAQRQGDDVVIEQDTSEGKITIWLSRHEAADLAAWICAPAAAAEPVP